jgi:hypothetical protein
MDNDDTNMANAALLLTEKIDERIAEAMANPAVIEALMKSPQLLLYIRGAIDHTVENALSQLAQRIPPTTKYWTSTTGTGLKLKKYW